MGGSGAAVFEKHMASGLVNAFPKLTDSSIARLIDIRSIGGSFVQSTSRGPSRATWEAAASFPDCLFKFKLATSNGHFLKSFPKQTSNPHAKLAGAMNAWQLTVE